MSALSPDWALALRAQLKAGLILAATIAGTRVQSERFDPIAVHPSDAASTFPLLCAYLLGEDGRASGGGTLYNVQAFVRIDVWTAGVSAGGRSAEEVVADTRDRQIAQVLRATALNPTWCAQFEKVPTYSVKRGAAANNAALVLGAGQIEIQVEFKQGLVLRPPEEVFAMFAMEARLQVADPTAAPDLTIIAQPPQEAT